MSTVLGIELEHAEPYFATARERYQIRQRRLAGQEWPWTDDEIFQKYRFCNVHREHDKTTEWFRDHIRTPMSNFHPLQLVEATLIFRWFNRIETGQEVIDLLLFGWNTDEARRRLTGVQPIVTGAFMIKSPTGLTKLEGLLQEIDNALDELPYFVSRWGDSLEDATKDLASIRSLGPFLAYEIVTDLRWTPVLSGANDIMTWGNVGPGCRKGLGFVADDNPWHWNLTKRGRAEMLEVMRVLLELSRNPEYWPLDWPTWEMREVEHWACEYAKYCRGVNGERLKRRYR